MNDDEKQQVILEWLQQKHDELLNEAEDVMRSDDEEGDLRTVAAYVHQWACLLDGSFYSQYSLDEREQREVEKRLLKWVGTIREAV